MSAGHWREIELLQDAVAALTARIEALEAKRKPGRPAKSEEQSDE
jgi:BMFP domain-containing protein YqiC